MEKSKIVKEMKVKETIQRYPETEPVFIDYGLNCVSCPLAQNETIEEVAKAYNIDLQKFLGDLNKVKDKL